MRIAAAFELLDVASQELVDVATPLEPEAPTLPRRRPTAVLVFLESRGVPMSEAARGRIERCSDVPTLDQWLRRVPFVEQADQLFRQATKRKPPTSLGLAVSSGSISETPHDLGAFGFWDRTGACYMFPMPLYTHAARIQLTPSERDTTLRAMREAFAGGVERLRMAAAFGSFLRDTPAADIDVAVELDPDWSFRDPGRIAALLRSAVDAPLDFDVIPMGSASPSLRYRVAVEGVPLYERTEGAWSLFYRNAVVEWSDIALSLARTGHAVGPFPEVET